MSAGSAVTALEEMLGQWRADGPFAPEELARLDAAEVIPTAACRALDDAGLPAYYVPVRFGGRLVAFPEVVAMLRAVARQDLTVAIAHGKTFLGAVSVWVSGSPETAEWLARQIIDGAIVCWGLTEQGHGSDLLAGEVSAERTTDGWRLDGTKWLINNATRAQLACVLARTSAEGGPRGFSLFLVDKRELAPRHVEPLDKIPTHGIRGADISGLSFHDAPLPATALIGEPGKAGETVLKALQLTRTACAALSLGAGDHAIRLATRFARRRRLYGRPVAEMPLARDTIGRAAARLLLAEAVTAVATRAIHVLPREMSVFSAVCKAFVPTIVQEAIEQVAELLGARGYLTGVFEHGEFAKLERDHRLVAIFDGSTLVNRQLLISQFTRLGRGYGAVDPSAADRLSTLVTGPLPEIAYDKLTLISASGCGLTLAVPGLLHRVRELDSGGRLTHVLADFEAACARTHAAIEAYRPASGMPGAHAFALAELYELCVAGAACLLILASRPDDGRTWTLLRGCLELVVERLVPGRHGDDEVFATLAEHALTVDERLTLFARDQEDSPW
ncbi:acyl-CoA dehydrogenase family protein [Amycolatopsis pithecellobii]|uniref:Acyl-CoA dehydrogenase n=1 Tax=Amycolatopsis pithecellobii TaxID=664692 RepID=A0A6N7Z3F0_9PSEU|nr:acyl-CoA dehydrogenase [Amycolatopsis pithecellobii]MTD54650.1 acyl-CoA dehydrogenase [Amycolatopsis pithecellobii]